MPRLLLVAIPNLCYGSTSNPAKGRVGSGDEGKGIFSRYNKLVLLCIMRGGGGGG